MKLIFGFTVFAFFMDSAIATTIFSCEGVSGLLSSGTVMRIQMSQDDAGKLQAVVDGEKLNDPVTVSQANLAALLKYLSCPETDSKCLATAIAKNEALKDFGDLIGLARALKKDFPKERMSTLANLNVTELGMGKFYQIGASSKFGKRGVFEFYDRANRLRGRYLYNAEIMDCKNISSTSDKSSSVRNSRTRK